MDETYLFGITVLLSVFFLLASSIKILGWQKKIFQTQLELFIKYGFNRAIMFMVGLAELFGTVAIWSPGLVGILGSLALFSTSAGAIYCHLRFDTWKDGIPAMVTLSLSGIVIFFMSF